MRPLRIDNKDAPTFSVVPTGPLCPGRTRFHPSLSEISLFLSPASVSVTCTFVWLTICSIFFEACFDLAGLMRQ